MTPELNGTRPADPAVAAGVQLILPMAITEADDEHACVAALTEAGEWVRPEPVPLDAVADGAPAGWRYGRWMSVRLVAPTVADPRPEDRALLAEPAIGVQWPADRCRDWADRFTDPDVRSAFAGERSLGLVYARLHRAYVKAATGGRRFVRFAFSDSTGAEFDWIVPDVRVARPLLAASRWPDGGPAHARLPEPGPVLLTLGLTRPNNRFPGRFRGCHPLVVGVHPIPAATGDRPDAGGRLDAQGRSDAQGRPGADGRPDAGDRPAAQRRPGAGERSGVSRSGAGVAVAGAGAARPERPAR